MLSRNLVREQESEKVVADGDYIMREGDLGNDMFVVQSGRVIISKRMAGRDVVLATLGKGEFFGEMSLLESLPRDADARAEGEVKLLVLRPGGLLVRVRRDPTFAIEMLNRLSGRIRTLNAELEAALEAANASAVAPAPADR
jgi:CRP-like cAMP-binding protein